ncbi:DUF5658 family protein [Wukongibacter baidiensis]|uniref:DUF5658 family protein n=1 Tax=Wukongibacter baidiensis TaxID=1723361 RepID=UPI003D7F2ABB
MITKSTDSKLKISTNLILFLIYLLAIGDYVFTFWGVNVLNVISEANPLMVKFMDLPLVKGLLFRTIQLFFFLFLLKCVESKFESPKRFRTILLILLGIQIIPYVLHIIWISYYLSIIGL